MQKVLVFIAVVAIAAWGSSCKKCYRCYNECVQCSITLNNHVFSHVTCQDSFASAAAFDAAIAADTAQGYACVPSSPSYDRDFCVNKPGDESYQNYFNKGKRVTCDEK